MQLAPGSARSNAKRVAMNSQQWFNGAACGTCIEVVSPAMGFRNPTFAVVTDLCPESAQGRACICLSAAFPATDLLGLIGTQLPRTL